ncbi:MAG TPA: hypothetical protein VER11_05410 [Polyangiaceae bacterium]|nr:hypothetical protein [Polyangiaceae bacterium]
MSRNKVLAILAAVSVSACLYACGSDDDSQPSNTAGASGKAGSGGSSGKAGSGNTAGKGGTGAESGEGATAGESGSGSGGVSNGGDSGAGGDQNVAGDTGVSGAGGDGGAGGAASALTLSEACTAACVPAHNVTSCSTTVEVCIASCTSYNDDWVVAAGVEGDAAKSLNDDYLAAISCAAQHLPSASDYACNSGPTVNAWSPVAASACEAALCKWTCNDTANSVAAADEGVHTRCNCP